MAGLVIDASAMLAILRSETERDAVQDAVRSRRQAGARLLAPTTFWLEIINSLVRRHRWTSERVLEGLQVIDMFEVVAIEIDRPMVLLSLDLAERHGLTSYDATYLAVAIIEDADLLTLDSDLRLAAGDRAILRGGPPRIHEEPAAYEHAVTWPNYKHASAYLAKLRAEALTGLASDPAAAS